MTAEMPANPELANVGGGVEGGWVEFNCTRGCALSSVGDSVIFIGPR